MHIAAHFAARRQNITAPPLNPSYTSAMLTIIVFRLYAVKIPNDQDT